MTNDLMQGNRVTVFLDRDGTLNVDVPYLADPGELDLFPDVVPALGRLNRKGVRVVLITNQSGVARGLVSPHALESIHARLQQRLQSGGAWIDAIYYCPHHPDDGCMCRKPRPGLVQRACYDLGIPFGSEQETTPPEGGRRDLFVVGDQGTDLRLAKAIGGRGVLVTTGPASAIAVDSVLAGEIPADRVVAAFSEAVDWILGEIGEPLG